MKRLGAALVLIASAATEPFLGLAQDAFAQDVPRRLPGALVDDRDALVIAAFAALAAALLAWAVVRLLASPPDARRVALDRIDRARRLGPSAGPRALAHEVSEAVRAYAEARFSVHAPLLSTDALLSGLAQAASPLEPWRGPLADFLVCADLARSGVSPLSASELDALLGSARAFVLSEER